MARNPLPRMTKRFPFPTALLQNREADEEEDTHEEDTEEEDHEQSFPRS